MLGISDRSSEATESHIPTEWLIPIRLTHFFLAAVRIVSCETNAPTA